MDREFGTGALKITPGHDVNDYAIGQRHKLPMINIMNKDATLNENAGTYAGMTREAARKALWAQMGEAGLTIKEEPHTLNVPRSQRGGEIVEPMVSTQWFVKMEAMAQKGLDAVRDGRIRIVPERFEKVYFNWLENIRDWTISRQLWWGHRIPVWYVNGSETQWVAARSEAEAFQKAREQLWGRRDAGAGPRRARHLVLQSASGPSPRSAGRTTPRSYATSTRPRSWRPATTSSSSGWRA